MISLALSDLLCVTLSQDEVPGQEEIVVLSGGCSTVFVRRTGSPQNQSGPRPTQNQGTGLNPESGKLQNWAIS